MNKYRHARGRHYIGGGGGVGGGNGGAGGRLVSRGGGGGRGEGGCTQFVHEGSRMTIDPRIPTMPGTKHVGFSPTRQTLLAPSAKAP